MANEPAERPTSVTVMAIIGIIYGAMGFLCSPLALIPYFMTMPQPVPAIDAVKNDQLLFGWTMASLAMGWLLAIFLLIGAVGALGLKQWARQVLIGWAITSALLSIAGICMQAIVIMPRIAEYTRNQSGPERAGAAAGGMIGLVLGVLLGVGIPGTMLFIMTRPNVKDAFARGLRRVV
jgi:hypothetical protein